MVLKMLLAFAMHLAYPTMRTHTSIRFELCWVHMNCALHAVYAGPSALLNNLLSTYLLHVEGNLSWNPLLNQELFVRFADLRSLCGNAPLLPCYLNQMTYPTHDIVVPLSVHCMLQVLLGLLYAIHQVWFCYFSLM